MGFEDENDPDGAPPTQEEWQAWENERARENRIKATAIELLATCEDARNQLIKFFAAAGTAVPESIRVLKEELDAVIAKATGEGDA